MTPGFIKIVERLVAGEIRVVNVVESIAHTKLFMHLTDISLTSTQKQILTKYNKIHSFSTKAVPQFNQNKKLVNSDLDIRKKFLKKTPSSFNFRSFIKVNTTETQTTSFLNSAACKQQQSFKKRAFVEDMRLMNNATLHPIRCTTTVSNKQNEVETKHQNDTDVHIIILGDNNFKSEILNHKLILVMFFAPWCKYCNDMKPMFRRVAKELPKNVGRLAYCNGEESIRIALEYHVYVYPTLKLFRKGKYVTDYKGPRRSLEILKFLSLHSDDISG